VEYRSSAVSQRESSSSSRNPRPSVREPFLCVTSPSERPVGGGTMFLPPVERKAHDIAARSGSADLDGALVVERSPPYRPRDPFQRRPRPADALQQKLCCSGAGRAEAVRCRAISRRFEKSSFEMSISGPLDRHEGGGREHRSRATGGLSTQRWDFPRGQRRHHDVISRCGSKTFAPGASSERTHRPGGPTDHSAGDRVRSLPRRALRRRVAGASCRDAGRRRGARMPREPMAGSRRRRRPRVWLWRAHRAPRSR
jgi:hypothetical protein